MTKDDWLKRIEDAKEKAQEYYPGEKLLVVPMSIWNTETLFGMSLAEIERLVTIYKTTGRAASKDYHDGFVDGLNCAHMEYEKAVENALARYTWLK